MKKAIYKYVLDSAALRSHPEATRLSAVSVKVPAGAKILSVKAQRNEVCVWAQVDVEPINHEVRRFVLHGTGHLLENAELAVLEGCAFMDTVLLNDGHLVLHVFLENRP